MQQEWRFYKQMSGIEHVLLFCPAVIQLCENTPNGYHEHFHELSCSLQLSFLCSRIYVNKRVLFVFVLFLWSRSRKLVPVYAVFLPPTSSILQKSYQISFLHSGVIFVKPVLVKLQSSVQAFHNCVFKWEKLTFLFSKENHDVILSFNFLV